MVAEAPVRYRNSQLRLLRECRHAYAEDYIRATPPLPSPSLQAGDAVHRAIAEALRRVLGEGWLDVHDVAFRTAQGGLVEYADAVGVLTRFQEALGTEYSVDPKAVFFLEEMLEMPLELSDGTIVTYFGTPDLVERLGKNGAHITDWKTHWHPESEEEFRADPQLERYALLVHHHFPGFDRFELTKRFVRFRNSYHEAVITAAELERVRRGLISEIEHEREVRARGEFPATGGAWCGLCQYHHTCPAITDLLALSSDQLRIRDDEHASELAAGAIALGAAADRVKDQLKRYLGGPHATGRVPVSGGEYGYGVVQKRSAEVPTLRDVMGRFGLQLGDDVLRVDLTALDRLRDRLPENVVRAIEEEAIESWQTSDCRFRRTTTKAKATPTPARAAGELL